MDTYLLPFQEDATRMTHKSAGRFMATINNLVANLLALHGFRNIAQARRILDTQPDQAVAIVFGL